VDGDGNYSTPSTKIGILCSSPVTVEGGVTFYFTGATDDDKWVLVIKKH